jgi:NADPH:quinone reductase-like Zn-dependent oxidoreductase
MEHQMTQLLAHSSGDQDHLGDEGAQLSAPDRGEILVRVQACGPNHVDRASTTGAVSQLSPPGAPYTGGMDVAGSVIGAGDGVTRFAAGDEVFGHLPAGSWSWVRPPCVRTTADGVHIELRPEGLDPLAAATLAGAGLRATTLLRAAEPQPGETALVIGATSKAGSVLVPLLTEAGVHVIAYASGDPVGDALASHPDVDLVVDLVSFDEPYFMTSDAPHGTIVSALPAADGFGLPRIGISAEPGGLVALTKRALDGREPVDIAPRLAARKASRARLPAA